MHWINITATSTRENLDSLESWFWDHGAVSVTVEDGLDKPIYEPPPGEQPVWEEVLVTGLFEGDSLGGELAVDEIQVDELKKELVQAGFQVSDIAKLEDRTWEREWLHRFQPMQFGDRLWVCPSGFEIPEEAQAVIRLDPGLAFGTGTHETTRLCLEYLDGLDVSGWRVTDFGCGSGVLGIGAMLLGADILVAIDNDPQALVATKENAARNSVELTAELPGRSLDAADLVFANILAQPLVDLSTLLLEATKKGGLLILSGIMSSQADWVIGAYEGRARLVDQCELNGWVRLVWTPENG